jgi:hypothetical protein
MYHVMHHSKLIEIFCSCDDFCLLFEKAKSSGLSIGKSRKPTRVTQMSESEIMTIVIFYHLSGFKCFEYYYRELILKGLSDYFPQAVSYERFVSLMPRSIPLLYFYLVLCRCGQYTGIYYADSKKLPVCHNKRIHQNRVFANLADRGKSSMGWFFGFKLFLVINQYGQIMRCQITKASKADNNCQWMIKFFQGLKGRIFADKGFISSKAFDQLFKQDLKLITGIRNNMKNRLMDLQEKWWLKKRGVIESVNDILMTVCDIDHTRHRSPFNFFVNLFAGVIAYTYLDKLPSVFSKKLSLC